MPINEYEHAVSDNYTAIHMRIFLIFIQVACWKLAKEHKFNTSMFERLVNNHFPYTILTRQNRMHPNLVPLFSYHYVQQKKEAVNIKSMSRVCRCNFNFSYTCSLNFFFFCHLFQ